MTQSGHKRLTKDVPSGRAKSELVFLHGLLIMLGSELDTIIDGPFVGLEINISLTSGTWDTVPVCKRS